MMLPQEHGVASPTSGRGLRPFGNNTAGRKGGRVDHGGAARELAVALLSTPGAHLRKTAPVLSLAKPKGTASMMDERSNIELCRVVFLSLAGTK